MLPSGTVVDTAAPGAAQALEQAEPELVAGLRELRETVHADAGLVERIRSKYSRKNTTGYSLNAFVDFSEPLDVLTHLLYPDIRDKLGDTTNGFIRNAAGNNALKAA